MFMKAISTAFFILWASIAFSAEVAYEFKTVADPSARHTLLFGISDLDDLVGATMDCDFCSPDPVLYSDGTFYDVGVDGAASLSLFGINRDGSMVGHLAINGEYFGFVMDDKNTTILDHAARAWGINNKGLIVGYESRGSPEQTAVLYRNGVYLSFLTTNEIPGILGSTATGIASNGDIVGYYWYRNLDGATVVQGFVRRAGKIELIEIIPLGINDQGVIAGYTGPSSAAAIIDENGLLSFIEYPGAFYTQVHGINNKGHLVGYYKKGAQYYGFVATPAPLPKPKPRPDAPGRSK